MRRRARFLSSDKVHDVPGDRPHNGRPSAYLSALTVRGFDRAAFGISSAEATAMDPQQRLVLECCAEALELGERRATPAPPGGDGEDVGVFAAIETSDYAYLQLLPACRRPSFRAFACKLWKRARKVKNDLEASSPYVYAARVERLGHRRVRSHG